MQSKTSIARVDHLIFGASSLEAGVDAIRDLLGVEPGPGGRHPAFGTCNALLSLGPEQYLEIIAPDPGLPAPEQGRLFDLGSLPAPRMVTWVLRTYDIQGDVDRARAAGAELGEIAPGSRTNPDGSVLEWRLTDPYAFPMDGALPFLLDWGNAPHPGGSAPAAGALSGLALRHPDPDALRKALRGLDLDFPVEAGEAGVSAVVQTPTGPVQLD